jgi:Flp pilus assembly CpaE family ATPase
MSVLEAYAKLPTKAVSYLSIHAQMQEFITHWDEYLLILQAEPVVKDNSISPLDVLSPEDRISLRQETLAVEGAAKDAVVHLFESLEDTKDGQKTLFKAIRQFHRQKTARWFKVASKYDFTGVPF